MVLSTGDLSVTTNDDLSEKEQGEELVQMRKRYDAMVSIATVCALALEGYLRARGYEDAVEFHGQLKANWELLLDTLS